MKRRVLKRKIARQERLLAKGGYHYVKAQKKGDEGVLRPFTAEQAERLKSRLDGNKHAALRLG